MELNDIMSPKIPKSIIIRIVGLRTKENCSIKKISEMVKLSTPIISEILEEKLNMYSEYSTTRTYVSIDNEKEIVRLRAKDRCSKSKISQDTRLSIPIISAILSDKLKDTRSEYSTIHTYVSNEDVKEIVQLRKEELSLKFIRKKLRLPLEVVKSVLRSELGDSYRYFNARNIPTGMKKQIFLLNTFKVPVNNISEITGVSLPTIKFIIQNFETIYNNIISNIQPRRAVISMADCHSFYLEIYD